MQATNFLPCKAPLYGGISRIPNQGKSFPLVRARRDLGDGDYAGRIVDDNMIVLRTRIRDLKISEEARCERAPFSGSQWTEWEEDYHELSCQKEGRGVIGFLHTWMMHQGPGSLMILVAILSLCTGITATWLVSAAMELARGLSG
ncbi:hypothetical protein MLD38_024404 [Melastoma candidum]|uniref:Uncharacterized protein n=1 Tax=Melastoma candidum TaxID=119954 RepID=A0ACB9NTW1_9MYRT|nr:hypothetical protein MLD38_024404 [Melastoma candidum]